MNKQLIASALIAVAATAAGGSAQAQSANFTVEPTHTFVTFEAKHIATSTNRGRFDKTDGAITLDRSAKRGTADINIDMASINTGTAPFNTHLKGKDLFNAVDFPKANFNGDKFTFEGEKVTSVAGNLTLLGKSLPVTLTANNFNCYDSPMLKREVCGGDFETTITRSQWGMNWGLAFGIPDKIRLLIQIEAIKQ